MQEEGNIQKNSIQNSHFLKKLFFAKTIDLQELHIHQFCIFVS